MTIQTVKQHGEYLGFCEMKGYIYSVAYHGQQYVVAVQSNDVSILITYTVGGK